MANIEEFTVSDHLESFGENPAWVFVLGDVVQNILDCDAAIAASRARDLARRPEVAKPLAQMLSAWEDLAQRDLSKLTPMQNETLESVLYLIFRTIIENFHTGGNKNA